VLKLEVAPVHIIEMTIQHMGHVLAADTLLNAQRMIYHTAEKRSSKNEFHEKQTQTSFRTTTRITYYGRTQKCKFFEFRALMGEVGYCLSKSFVLTRFSSLNRVNVGSICLAGCRFPILDLSQ